MTIATDKVVTRYEADSSQLLAELEKIRAAQGKMGASVDGLGSRLAEQNQGLEANIAKWVKGAAILGTAAVAFDFAKKAMHEYTDGLRMEAAASGVSIDQLSDAIGGLAEQDRLLVFAAKLKNSEFKITQDQMNIAATAARQLQREGKDLEEALSAIEDALVSGKTKGLDSFGLGLDDAKKKADPVGAIMDALTKKAGALTDSTHTSGEAMQAMGVKTADAWDNMQEKLGKVVVGLVKELEPAINAAAGAMSFMADHLSTIGHVAMLAVSPMTELLRLFGAFDTIDTNKMILQVVAMGGSTLEMNADKQLDAAVARIGAAAAARRGRFGLIAGGMGGAAGGGLGKGVGKKGKGGGATRDPFAGESASLTDALLARLAAEDERARQQMLGEMQLDNARLLAMNDNIKRSADEMTAKLAASKNQIVDVGANAHTDSKLAAIFGPIEDFNLYTEAWGALESGVSSAFAAWANGDSAAAAIKKALKATLVSAGTEMSIMALKESAYGFGSLAYGNVASASQHFQSAGLFAAGAAAAGVAARGIGSGSSSGGGRASNTIGPANGNGGGGSQNITVVVGDDFADDSQRKRAANARRLVQLGLAGASRVARAG